MKERILIPEKLREEIYQNYNSRCADCGQKPIHKLKEINGFLDIEEEWNDLKYIDIFCYTKPCWHCGKNIKIYTYWFELFFQYSIGDVEKIDMALCDLIPSIKKIHNNFEDTDIICNVCPHCSSQQGSFHIARDVSEMLMHDSSKWIPSFSIANNFSLEDLYDCDLDEVKAASQDFEIVHHVSLHIHHINEDPSDNRKENLILLCPSCHHKKHLSKKI